MNILLIAPSDPVDVSTGGAQRTNFLHRALSLIGTVYTVVPVMTPYLEKIDSNRRVAWICAEYRWSLSWFINKLLQRVIPLVSVGSKVPPAHWSAWAGVEFDLVVCRYSRLAAYSRAWDIAPLYLDVDDLPVESHRTVYCKQQASLPQQLMNWITTRVVTWWSEGVFRRTDGLWLANPEQVNALNHLNSGYLMNLPRKPNIEPSHLDQQDECILSVGYLGYSANYLGVDSFLDCIWPNIQRHYPQLQYLIIGRELPSVFQEKWGKISGVQLLGFVDDIEQAYSKALFSVAPVYAGSGTCIKVLESLRLGRVCVATNFASRGLKEYQLQENGLIVTESDKDMIVAALKLLGDPEERIRLQSLAVQAIQEQFNFDRFARQVQHVIQPDSKPASDL